MATSNSEKKSFFDTWFDAQKNVMENWYNTTEKMTQKTADSAKEAQETSSDYLKNWYDSQMAFFRNNNGSEGKGENPFATTNPVEFFNNWMKTQSKMAEEWSNGMNKWGSAFSGNMNPMSGTYTNGYDSLMGMQRNWMDMMNRWNSEMMSRFGMNGHMNPMMGMNNFADGYNKFMEFWMPMFKAMQDKSFTPETWKQYFEPARYKELMDKMFNFNSDSMKPMFQNYFNMMSDYLRQTTGSGRDMFKDMASQMGQFFPHNENSPFVQYMGMYNEFMNNFMGAESPFIKMMTPGAKRDQMVAFNEMGNDVSQYMMKRSEMQYMMYMTGLKAVEALAESIYAKMEKGEEFDSFMKFYNEWLGINDKVFLELFSSDEYSKVQSEVTEVSLKLKTDMDKMMEGMFQHFPLVPRSEMDHLYKTIYDLKKKVRNMEKEAAKNTKAETSDNAKASAEKAETQTQTAAPAATKSANTTTKATAAKKSSNSSK